MRPFVSVLLLLSVSLQLTLALNNPYDLDASSSESIEIVEDEKKCPSNYYFSERHNRCSECTECGVNLYEKEKCEHNKDTVCDWCLTANPSMNEEYFRQCNEYTQLYEKLRDELKAEISEGRQSLGISSKRFDWLLWLICVLATACFTVVVFAVGCLCCVRKRYTRVINVSPPELNDVDQHNIIFAAKQVREKLAKRGGEVNYEYL